MTDADDLLGLMEMSDYEEESSHRTRECQECSHYDHINACCWQSGPWGLCFDVDENDLCHLGYENYEVDDR